MMFAAGLAVGAIISFVVLVAFMAPKHWETHQENVDLRSQLRVAVERAAHYQNLVSPIQWGPQELHEARIVEREKNKVQAWDDFEDLKEATNQDHKHEDDIKFKFDDIRNGGD